MKFLLDVHISRQVARALSDQGHDILRAAELHSELSDKQLLALAVAEARVIVTEDSDFSDLVYAFAAPSPPAIIYLRCEPKDQGSMPDRILQALASASFDRHMVVIKASHTRYRPLPDTSNDNG
ncbi:DUF5615 family PIN-like protein [uncultured Sphingomonas sp.]|uniref:DUF5615 family PIN-like protein n=1 Tax=uncultured Sphingomonas sp. TaxID=158754 RepID=UPI0035C9D941